MKRESITLLISEKMEKWVRRRRRRRRHEDFREKKYGDLMK